MNSVWLKNFLKIGLEIAKSAVPAIAAIEMAVKKLKAGKDKKDAIMEIIKNSPAIAEFLIDKEVVDEELFARGISKVNDGYVDIMNAIKSNTKLLTDGK